MIVLFDNSSFNEVAPIIIDFDEFKYRDKLQKRSKNCTDLTSIKLKSSIHLFVRWRGVS